VGRRSYTGAGIGIGIGIHIPLKQPGGNQVLDADTRTRNALLRGLRAQGEHGFALLKRSTLSGYRARGGQ
jgi:hypothetical protein